jgi:uncharacterized protein YukE
MTLTDTPTAPPHTALTTEMDNLTEALHTRLLALETQARRFAEERDRARAELEAVRADRDAAIRLAENETTIAMVARNLLTDRDRDLRAARDGAYRHKSEADRLSERCRNLAEALDDLRTEYGHFAAAHKRCARRRFWRRGRHQ